MLVNEMLRVVVEGGTVTDADVRAADYGIRYYELTTGDMSQTWHACRPEELGAFIEALATLRTRLDALTPPEPSVDEEAVALAMEIANLEERAQDAEDREKLNKARELRLKARELKTRLAARSDR